MIPLATHGHRCRPYAPSLMEHGSQAGWWAVPMFSCLLKELPVRRQDLTRPSPPTTWSRKHGICLTLRQAYRGSSRLPFGRTAEQSYGVTPPTPKLPSDFLYVFNRCWSGSWINTRYQV